MEPVDDESDSLLESENHNNASDTTAPTHSLSGKDLPIFIYVLFIVFGTGASFLLLDALVLEIPYWQQHQPEGITLANKMTISGVMPIITVFPLYFIIINSTKISWRKLMYLLIILQTLSCLLCALFWNVTINDVSIIIQFVTFMAGFTGYMMVIAIVPYFTSLNNKLSAPLFTGSNIASLLSALLGLIQQPGSEQPLFGPTIYFLIWIPLFILSLVSYIYLDRKYMKQIEKQLAIKSEEVNTDFSSRIAAGMISTCSIPIWWRQIWRFTALNAYLNLVTWVLIRSSLPFAAKHISKTGENTETLQYAIGLSYVAVVLGSCLSIIWKINQEKYFWYLSIVYTCVSVIFFWIALDTEGLWIFSGADELLVSVVFILRFLDGYLSPLIYETVDKLYPSTSHQMNQWISVIGMVVSFIGIWITYFLVEYG